jgi:hypothetical protein
MTKSLWNKREFTLLDAQTARQPEILADARWSDLFSSSIDSEHPRLVNMLSKHLVPGGAVDQSSKLIASFYYILCPKKGGNVSEILFGNIALVLSELFKRKIAIVPEFSILEAVARKVLDRGMKAKGAKVRKNAGVCLSCMIVFDDRLRAVIKGGDGLEFLHSLRA